MSQKYRVLKVLLEGIEIMITVQPKKMFILLVFMMLPSYAFGQKEMALNQPVVEGKSILGIKLGDSESKIFELLGFPDKIESAFDGDVSPSQQNLKFLLYGLDKNIVLFIFTKNKKVEVLQLIWSGEGTPAYKGKTSKGIGLGDSMEDVKRHYGECEMSRGYCWYKNLGISLGGDKVVMFITIAASGIELPDYLKSSF
jgi:hypothetical protein